MFSQFWTTVVIAEDVLSFGAIFEAERVQSRVREKC